MFHKEIPELYQFVYHPVFLSGIFSWFLAQVLKAIIEVFKQKLQSSKDLLHTLFWRTGGMPSSHSAMVTALATSIAFVEGVSSPIFILSFFFCLITVRDALGVRRSAGEQARRLNELGETFKKEHPQYTFYSVKEVLGHTAPEVSVGMLLGFFIAVAFCKL